ncbi:YihY family inner membrane protein [Natronolimnobius sp. AArcel1]|uniref:YihY/virulence factor BrkB family protein n=1 Tax=Natronolimnobius sp. AArcel1 TaxID=1679093 RepID=UPI0013ED45AF|nr:YihY/virulence factor BrkB family protein [Natronolimnobius sp. AArcel1]NGM70972.1 YihY family inner membrane protein [Natronolimnobius sp. AArcel1]
MGTTAGDAVSFGKSIVAGIQAKKVPFMAASLAYQAFISLLPLLVLLFFVVTILGDEQFASQTTAATEGFLPESGQLLIEEAITDSPATAGSTLIGLVILLWGSLKIFRGLDTAFSEIYESGDKGSFVSQLQDALLVLGTIGGALIAAVVASLVLAFFPDIPFIGIVQPLFLVVILSVAFFPMYYFFPDVSVAKREVIPGVLVAAIGWTILQSLFSVYVSFAGDSEAAGPLGAILLLLTWLYFGSMILLVGGVINAVGAGRIEVTTDEEDDLPGIPDSDRPAFVDRERRTHERLERSLESVTRERDLLKNDLRTQRQRRYQLEDRLTELEAERESLEHDRDRLEAKNVRLRQRLDVAEDTSGWRWFARQALAHVRTIRIGTSSQD